MDTLSESIQILIGWPGFPWSQLCLSFFSKAIRQSSVAPSPASNKSSHLYNTVVCTPFGRQMILPTHCTTCFTKFIPKQGWGKSVQCYTVGMICRENMYNCRQLPCAIAWANLLLFCLSQQVMVLRVVMELQTIFSACLLSLYHKSGSNSREVQHISKQSQVLGGKRLCSYRFCVSQFSGCIAYRKTVTATL